MNIKLSFDKLIQKEKNFSINQSNWDKKILKEINKIENL